MGFDKQEVHRAGVFKKANKSHKTGRHRSKGSIANDNQGTTYCSIYKNQYKIRYNFMFS
jgi:hypothetical protein